MLKSTPSELFQTPKRILYIEDDRVVVLDQTMKLTQSGYQVIHAANGEDAIRKANSGEHIDLILSDIELGKGIDGTEAVSIILKDHDIPAIFLSSHTDSEIVGKTENITNYGYIVKNSSSAVLDASIKMALNLFEAKQEVLRSEKDYSSLFKEMINGFAQHEIVCDSTGKPVDYRFLKINPAFEKLTGIAASFAIGKTITHILPDIEDFWIEKYGKVALTGESIEFEHFSSELNRHYKVVAFSPKKGQFATVFEDITENKKAEEQRAILDAKLRKLATADQITGLPNKYALTEELEGRLAHDENSFYLVKLNIRNFGSVASIFGGEIADDYMRIISQKVKDLVLSKFPGSYISRPTGFAGFDFILNSTKPKDVEALSQDLAKIFKEFQNVGKAEVSTEFYIAACSSEYAENAQDILQKTMLTLQEVKKACVNLVSFYDIDLFIKHQEKIKLDHNISHGLAHGEFVPFYQPQVSIDGKVLGYEVLARWQQPDGKILPPAVFIEPMTRMNLLGDLFYSMLHQTCANFSQITDPDIKCSINVSPTQFSDPNFMKNTIHIVESYGISPKSIKLEILEDTVTQTKSLKILGEMNRHGFSFAIDDYGEGFNSLLPISLLVSEGVIDTIKIARELVSDLLKDGHPNQYEAVSPIIEMARKWGLNIIAEGVEKIEELNIISDLCSNSNRPTEKVDIAIQGYYFAKPMSFEDIINK